MPSTKKAAVKTAPRSSAAPKKAAAKKTAKPVAGASKARPKKAAKKAPAARGAGTPKAAGKATKKATGRAAVKKASSRKAAPRKAATRKATTRRATTRKATTRKATTRKATTRKATTRKATKEASARKGTLSAAGRRRDATRRPVAPRGAGKGPAAIAGLAEEDQIRAAKFIPRETSAGSFAEERFLFPESYGVDRVRLLVRDPDWIFAYWDVSSDSMRKLVDDLGERAYALSRLTLRVVDPTSGGQSDILLPPGARWWYIRSDAARRTYRAEIGVTLPTGDFRVLAGSNTVVTPRVGPSRDKAERHLSYRDAAAMSAAEAADASRAERQAGLAGEAWAGGKRDAAEQRGGASESFRPRGGEKAEQGGASESFRPGASDAWRR
jgi:hypothetical protein